MSHPRWALAVKGALAAAVAWFVGLVAPPPFAEYPYYAPLGAVLATTSTVVRSVRESLQSIAAVLLGAVIAQAVSLLPLPGPVEVALVVGVAILCVGWRVFGEMGSWAVMSAIFVLILGTGEGPGYVVSYAGLIIVGAAIGIGVNLLLPPLPLTPSELALGRLRDGLAEQVEALADRLDSEGHLDPTEWEQRRRQLLPTIEGARTAIAQTHEAARGNLRVRHNRDWVASQTRRAGALGIAAEVVEDVTRLLVAWEREGLEDKALGEELRPQVAASLRAFGVALRLAQTRDAPAGAESEAATDALEPFDTSVEELREVVRAAQRSAEYDYFVAAAVVVHLTRAATALRP